MFVSLKARGKRETVRGRASITVIPEGDKDYISAWRKEAVILQSGRNFLLF